MCRIKFCRVRPFGSLPTWKGLLLLVLVCLFAGVAHAHRLNEHYIYLDVAETSLKGRFDFALTDLDKIFALDTNADGKATPEEYRAKAAQVEAELESRLVFYTTEATHPVTVTGSETKRLGKRAFALVYFDVPSLDKVPTHLDVEYQQAYDNLESTHRSMLLIENNPWTKTEANESQVSLIFAPGEERQQLSLIGPPWTKTLITFIKHGVWHIWIGIDHILFIVSLLLPSVMILRGRQWEPVGDFRSAFIFVVKVVTLFTVAHSVTLSLAALGIVRLPERLVEAVIAASIIVVALNNIFPLFNRRIWFIVFGFGLFHGLGFANVLSPLGVEKGSLVMSLVGFNVGVEIGQLAIIAVVFPMLFLVRNWRPYQFRVLGLGSMALIAVSAFWFVERAFDL